MAEHTEQVTRVAEMVERAQSCMLTTMTLDGRHHARPMAVQEVEFDGDLWFFAYSDSAKVADALANPQVNVSFANDKDAEWTSITGTVEVVEDRQKAEELWSAPLKIWFPDGPGTPGLVLLKVHAEGAEYWDGPSSKVARMFGAVRAAVSGDPDKFPPTTKK